MLSTILMTLALTSTPGTNCFAQYDHCIRGSEGNCSVKKEACVNNTWTPSADASTDKPVKGSKKDWRASKKGANRTAQGKTSEIK